MRVLTLDNHDFSSVCSKLADEICKDAELPYCAIIGIATGGVYVCREICKSRPDIASKVFTISSSRPTTKFKTSIIGKILRRLPHSVNNRLRIIESKLLSRKKRPDDIPIVVPAEATQFLSEAPRRILIVDDAIDSGSSMIATINAIKKINPNTLITSAVITVTTKSPFFLPDYAIFRNSTLIRFPWSKDAKSEHKHTSTHKHKK